MAKKIVINETVEADEDFVDLLHQIANQIDEGYTSGYYPTWGLAEVLDED